MGKKMVGNLHPHSTAVLAGKDPLSPVALALNLMVPACITGSSLNHSLTLGSGDPEESGLGY